MNICRRIDFGPVTAFEFGFGPIGKPLMTVMAYLADGVLIDTAQRRMQSAVLKTMASHQIDAIALTHHHEDHSGNAAALSQQRGIPVFGHRLTARKMKRKQAIMAYQHLIWGSAPPVPVKALGDKLTTPHLELAPIHTPGHCPDHTVFLERRNGWLFSGDLYLGTRIKYFRRGERIADQIRSLKTVLQHDFDVLLCAHHPVFSGGRQRLAAKLQFLEDICGRVRQLQDSGYGMDAIIRAMGPARDHKEKWITQGDVSFAHMIRSAMAANGSRAPF